MACDGLAAEEVRAAGDRFCSRTHRRGSLSTWQSMVAMLTLESSIFLSACRSESTHRVHVQRDGMQDGNGAARQHREATLASATEGGQMVMSRAFQRLYALGLAVVERRRTPQSRLSTARGDLARNQCCCRGPDWSLGLPMLACLARPESPLGQTMMSFAGARALLAQARESAGLLSTLRAFTVASAWDPSSASKADAVLVTLRIQMKVGRPPGRRYAGHWRTSLRSGGEQTQLV